MPPKQRPFLSRITRAAGQLLLVTLLTLVALEAATRLLLRGDDALNLFGRRVELLPRPLVSAADVASLQKLVQTPDSYLQYDPHLGWSVRPNARQTSGGATYTSNSIGIRSLTEFSPLPPGGVIRLAAFGPSFTHGDEVNDDQTWEAQLQRMQPNLEVMNWGLGGYGLDQSFLRYKLYGAAYHPDIVIIGSEEGTWGRNAIRFPPFRNTRLLPVVKPVYALQADELTLIENPYQNFDEFYHALLQEPEQFLAAICPGDYFCDETRYRRYPLDGLAAFRLLRTLQAEVTAQAEPQTAKKATLARITTRVTAAFVTEVRQNGATPLAVFYPTRFETMQAFENGTLNQYHTQMAALKDAAQVDAIDLAPAFVQAKQQQNLNYQDFFVGPDGRGHYNALGNQVVARAILNHLCQHQHLPDCS
ncbi:MAG: hypothetical protein ACE5G8_03420 [Anaerolineae bacterium]